MSDIPDWFKIRHKKSIQDLARQLPTRQAMLGRAIARLTSQYPPRTLGFSESGEVTVSEEERYLNFHVLGAPGEGKSKFLEYHIRRDIEMGNGLCLLDPSEGGDTAQNVLNYCARINYKKVILIDPSLVSQYKKIPCLAPLNQKAVKRSVEGVMEALEILFDAKATSTPRIKRYLSALLRILARQGLTLREARYFSDYYRDIEERKAILGSDRDSSAIRNLFRSEYKYDTFLSSSINRLDALWQEPLASILGNTEGINFMRAVGDGWVILVNLSPYHLTEDEAELLGIIVISQIIQAVDSLANRNWKGVFYLYIDEVGRFATPQIETLLSYKRKSGLRLYLAHHHFDQFENRRKVLSSIENNARIKLMFNTPNFEDRMRMIKALGYGGDIPHALAAYANQDLPKQSAVLKKNKEAPVRIRIPDVEDVPEAPRAYIEEILSQPFYKDVRTIPENTRSSKRGEMDESEATGSSAVSEGIPPGLEKAVRPDHKKPPDPPPKRPPTL